MSPYQIFVQSIAILAVGLFSLSFQTKTRKNILLFQLVSFVAWFIHFYLLSAWTGAALIVVNTVITTFFLFKDQKKWIDNRTFLLLAIVVLAIITALTWQAYFSIFAFFALISITIAKWQNNPNSIRQISIVASVFWIIYDAFVGSYGGIISEAIIITSACIGLMRKLNQSK